LAVNERRVQCEFFIPIARNSDKKPHQPIAWILLVNEIRRLFPAGHSGPETFYRGDALLPGEYQESPGSPPVSDTSRRYILAISEGRVNDLRLLLKLAAHPFDQQAVYLSVAGTVEFVTPTEEDGYL
jgi:hypothetical protein